MPLTPERLIALLGLAPLPVEGGYFRQTYRASEQVVAMALPGRYTGTRSLGSAIYYLLHGAEFSALHRLQSDEVYHFYLGDPVEMLLLYPDGRHSVEILGPDLEQGQHLQLVVPHDVWQGSRLQAASNWALLGTTMVPAYQQEDFELGDRAALLRQYPQARALIEVLTP
jgi:predicted cupin superfamily sugar epimerase